MVYWSNTELADRLRGTPKPEAASSKGWDEWRTQAKGAHPFRYWLAEDALDAVQDVITFPVKLFKDIGNYIDNRWVTKTHALSSNLKKGEYRDLDTRILHCLFDELANHVEVELARKQLWFDGDKTKKSRKWRSPELGTKYLAEETALIYDENWVAADDARFGQPTPQAIAAQEILDLYHWWSHTRPARLDPYVATGWDKICDEAWSGETKRDDPQYQERSRKVLEQAIKLEEEEIKEDTEMLIRLIKVRGSLWS
jgi:hypothetical protein